VPFLHAEPLSWVSSGVRIFRGEDELTQLKITAIKSKGSFQLDGEEFTIEPKGFFQSEAVLKKGSSVIAKVKKNSVFRRRFEVSSAGHRLVLESKKWTGRDYVLLLGNQEVGWVRREGLTGKKIELEFPDEVPVVIQILLTYVVLSQARREAAAGAASGG